MTQADHNKEYNYRLSERLGMMCGADKPTDEQEQAAREQVGKEMDELEKAEIEGRTL